jgi:hypothetical protein
MRADFEARTLEVEELTERLTDGNHTHIETERRLAEARAALRTADQAVATEVQHRAALQILLEERQRELNALRVENERMQAALETERRLRELQTSRLAGGGAPVAPGMALPIPASGEPGDAWAAGATIVPLPARETAALARLLAVDPTERTPESETVEKIASEIGRMAGEAQAGLQNAMWRAPARADAARPTLLRAVTGNEPPAQPAAGSPPAAAALERTPEDRTAESRFFEALEEIRSMKRAGSAPPGE